MKTIICGLLLLAFNASAAGTFACITGDDSHDCLTVGTACRTIQRAVNALPGPGMVSVCDGLYTAGANISHFKDLTIFGNRSNPSAVVIDIQQGETGFWIQDVSIVTIAGMTLNCAGSGCMGIQSRQLTIVDYSEIIFGAMPNGGHVSASEMSKTNCVGAIQITGDAVYHVSAGGMSTASIGCEVTLHDAPAFFAFAIASENSLIKATHASHIGTASGFQYIMDGSLMTLGGSMLPGSLPGALSNGGRAR